MSPTPAISEVTPEAPWLGLRSYGEGDTAHFFGRDKELADLRDRVLHKPLTILFGQSGWGKTSLLQAGLVPQLRKDGFLPVIIRLVHDEGAGSLEAQVIGALAKALHDAGCAKAAAEVSATLAEGGTASLWLLLHDPVFGLTGADGAVPQPVFIFDQFEEMFTLGDKPERRAATLAFRDVLASLVENRPNAAVRQRIAQDEELADRVHYQARSYRVLLALRYDFLHLLERWRKQMPSLMDNRMELRLLAGPQAFEAVVRPGQKRPGQPPIIPEEVGRAIVRFVAGVAPDVPLMEIDAVPPLLSLICSELNSQRQALGLDQISQSQFEGSGAEILNSFYERSFDAGTYGAALEAVPLGGATLQALRRLIEDRLLSAEGFRESIAFDTMLWELSGKADADTAKKVLALLVERRLLSVDERGGVQRLELTHDVLTRVARASREARKEKEALEKARLDQERAEADKQKALAEKNRLRKFALAAAACAIAAIIAAVFGWVGMQRAREAAAEARRQEAEANTQREQARRQEAEARRQEAEAKRQQAEARLNLAAATEITENVVSQSSAKLGKQPGMQTLRSEIVGQVLASYRALSQQAPDDPAVQAAHAHAELEDLLAKTELDPNADQAEPLLRAFNTLEAAASKQPENRSLQIYKLNAINAVHRFVQMSGRRAEAKKLVMDHLAEGKAAAELPKSTQEAHLAYARLLNAAGNLADDVKQRAEFYAQAIEATKPFAEAARRDSDYLRAYCSPRINLGDRHRLDGDFAKAAVLLEEAVTACRQAVKNLGNLPMVLETMIFAYISSSDLEYTQEKRAPADKRDFTKGVSLAEDAMDGAQILVRDNPDAPKFLTLLAESQKTLGLKMQERSLPMHLQRKVPFYLKQSAINYMRAAEKARNRADMWNSAAESLTALTGSLSAIDSPETAEFLEKRAHCFELAAQLPSLDMYGWLALANCFKDLASHWEKKKDYAKAWDYALQGLAAYTRHPKAAEWKTEESFTIAIVNLMNTVDDLLTNSQPQENAFDLLEAAVKLQNKPANRMRAANYVWSCRVVATAYLKVNSADKAEKLLNEARRALAAQPANPPHYYLLQEERALHFAFADFHEKQGRTDEAYAERYTGYEAMSAYHGKTPELERLKNPTRDDLARLKSTAARLKPASKRFTIPCDQNGEKVNVDYYIRDHVPDGVQPIGDQLDTFRELGIEVPKDVLDSFAKLYKIAVENKVGFIDLCTYALAGGDVEKQVPSAEELAKFYNQQAAAAADPDAREKAEAEFRKRENYYIEKLQKDITDIRKKLSDTTSSGRTLILKSLFDTYLDLAIQTSTQDQRACLEAIGGAYQTLVQLEIETTDENQSRHWRARIAEVESYARDKFKNVPVTAKAATVKPQTKDAKVQLTAEPEAVQPPAKADNASGKDKTSHLFTDTEKRILGNEDVVLLLAGKNNYGDKIFNYLKIKLSKVDAFLDLTRSGKKYVVKDYGEVIAAGLGEPSAEVKKRVESEYKILDPLQSSPAAPGEAKAPPSSALPPPPVLDRRIASVKEARAELAKAPSDMLRFNLAGELGNSAFAALFQKRYKDVVAWSREALDLIAACKPDYDPKERADLVFIYGNLAHALLFQGKYEEAIRMYKDHWEAPIQGRTFKEAVAEDFAMLERAGIGKEEMARARKELGLPAAEAAAAAPAKEEKPPAGAK